MADEAGAADVRESYATGKRTGTYGERISGTPGGREVAAAAVQAQGDGGEEGLAADGDQRLNLTGFPKLFKSLMSIFSDPINIFLIVYSTAQKISNVSCIL